MKVLQKVYENIQFHFHAKMLSLIPIFKKLINGFLKQLEVTELNVKFISYYRNSFNMLR